MSTSANNGQVAVQTVVNSYNEWDPLEEVIVGVIDGACVPPWHIALKATMPDEHFDFFRKSGGMPFPREEVAAANRDLDEFVRILEAEGIVVRRPDSRKHDQPFATPDWNSPSGIYAAMPRDVALVIGNEIIEAPMAWRSRYFEIAAYRSLIKEYFRQGALWTAAPKPELRDEFYNFDYREPAGEQDVEFVINEVEPTFDAADFIKCGRDIFVQKSHVTNDFGISWLRTHLGDKYTIHRVEVADSHPMHIDATLMPLAPGIVLVNRDRLPTMPEMFRSWKVLYAPEPCIPDSHKLYMTSKWLSMNILMLDEKRIMVERNEERLIKMLKANGFQPIPCSFRNFNTFGGSFHCATLDIRRRGSLQSYF
jgi:glycine amidinotransferase